MPGAALAAAAIPAVTSIATAAMSGGASGTAAGQQAQSADAAAALARDQWMVSRDDLSPFRDLGKVGITAFRQLFGLNPDSWASGEGVGSTALTRPFEKFSFNPANFSESPDYRWRLSQGTEAVMNNLSRFGGVGGNALKELTNYGQGAASQEFDKSFGRAYQTWAGNQSAEKSWRDQIFNWLSWATGSGQNAAVSTGGFGQNAAAMQGDALIQAGNARAAGTVGGANAMSGAVGAAGGGIGNFLMYNKLFSDRPSSSSPVYGADFPAPASPGYGDAYAQGGWGT